jgi:hypothetical protein
MSLEAEFQAHIATHFPPASYDLDAGQLADLRRIFFAGCWLAYSSNENYRQELVKFYEAEKRGAA